MSDVPAKSDPVTDFQDRLIERVRKDIGELLPDEVLQEVVGRAFQKAFFEERTFTEGSGYHAREIKKEPLLVEIVREQARNDFKAAAIQWMSENPEVMANIVEAQFKSGIAQGVIDAVNSVVQGEVANLRMQIRDAFAGAGISLPLGY